jgi:NADH dehydrogenase [ubiquinone] 1 alpha subcomplex assembly factor 7
MFQAHFLQALGLEQRVGALAKAAPPERRVDIERAAKRLVDATGMGAQYKFLALEAGHTGAAQEQEAASVYPFEM